MSQEIEKNVYLWRYEMYATLRHVREDLDRFFEGKDVEPWEFGYLDETLSKVEGR